MKAKRLFGTAAAIIAALFLVVFSVGATPAEVEPTGAYDFSIEHYTVEMDVSADRTVQVQEKITVSFTGSSSHGIIRDFPLEEGLRYKHIKATCDSSDFSPYTSFDDPNFLSLYLRGDGVVKGLVRTYTINYTMIVPALEDKGYLPLDIIGYGWQATIHNVEVRVTVPDGLTDYNVFSGYYGTKTNKYAQVTQEGNTLTLTAESLSSGNGITLDLKFADGVLSTAFDDSILYAIIFGAAAVALALMVKFLLCRQPVMTTTVNLEAPDEMDPLLMGKLIDNTVDNEDLGALVFYLADRGYLKIDMSTSEKNPTLFKTEQDLSTANEPDYVKTFYRGLFGGRNSVRISDLTNSFYLTAQTVTKSVGITATQWTGGLFEPKSKFIIGLLGVISLLLLGGFTFLYSLITVFGRYFYWTGFGYCLFSFAISAAVNCIAMQKAHKWGKGRKTLVAFGGFLLGLTPAALFLFSKNPAYGITTNLILVICSSLAGVISGRCLVRTRKYSDLLGHILGFKQFILYTEQDKIEFMLKDDPELFYHILPYAQVLGLTDAWTDKFKGLSVQPPKYVYGRSYSAFDVIVWNSAFRRMNSRMSQSMVSRPSSSGSGGSHSGSFGGGGGFGGGGFGGGGGRGC